MRQKLVFERAHFKDRQLDDADEVMEDRLNEETPWELAFEKGVERANDEMVEEWLDEDEFE